jgi:hypothetical protein
VIVTRRGERKAGRTIASAAAEKLMAKEREVLITGLTWDALKINTAVDLL